MCIFSKNIDVKRLKLYHAQFMLKPDLINPQTFAAEKQILQGTLPLDELDERVWSHEYLADKEAVVHIVLRGGEDRRQRLFLDLKIQCSLVLVCQRCMCPMPSEINENAHIVLFADEAKLDEAMLADDELEGMVLTKGLDVKTLVEDQILMAMPYAPRHENCIGEVVEAVNQDKPNPFAVLAGLKGKK